MKKQTLFFVAPLIFLISVTAEFAWGQDVILEGTTGSGVYTSPANIIAQNNFTIDNGVEVFLIATDSTILRPGSSVKAGGILISFESDGDTLPDDWEMEHFPELRLAPEPNGDADSDGLLNLDEYLNNTDPNNSDSDDDGMPDDWEVRYNLLPLFDDANVDGDVDGLFNIDEYLNDTDPTDPDSEDDGMEDGWEVQYGLNPNFDEASEDILDNDELTNINEYLNGTDPTNPDTDGDGMDDKWEVDNGLEPLNDDAGDDLDADGLTNNMEYENGFDPDDDDYPPNGNYYEYDALGRIKNIVRKQ